MLNIDRYIDKFEGEVTVRTVIGLLFSVTSIHHSLLDWSTIWEGAVGRCVGVGACGLKMLPGRGRGNGSAGLLVLGNRSS